MSRRFLLGTAIACAWALPASCASNEDGVGSFSSGGTFATALDASSDGAASDASGGSAGTSGSSGTGGKSGGTCNPAFCPNTGHGSPCCVTNDGPCGVDTGIGCQQPTSSDL